MINKLIKANLIKKLIQSIHYCYEYLSEPIYSILK